MRSFLKLPQPRRAMLLTLNALILVSALLLLCLVMEVKEPLWSRPAIALQLFALALGNVALGLRQSISGTRRFHRHHYRRAWCALLCRE